MGEDFPVFICFPCEDHPVIQTVHRVQRFKNSPEWKKQTIILQAVLPVYILAPSRPQKLPCCPIELYLRYSQRRHHIDVLDTICSPIFLRTRNPVFSNLPVCECFTRDQRLLARSCDYFFPPSEGNGCPKAIKASTRLFVSALRRLLTI